MLLLPKYGHEVTKNWDEALWSLTSRPNGHGQREEKSEAHWLSHVQGIVAATSYLTPDAAAVSDWGRSELERRYAKDRYRSDLVNSLAITGARDGLMTAYILPVHLALSEIINGHLANGTLHGGDGGIFHPSHRADHSMYIADEPSGQTPPTHALPDDLLAAVAPILPMVDQAIDRWFSESGSVTSRSNPLHYAWEKDKELWRESRSSALDHSDPKKKLRHIMHQQLGTTMLGLSRVDRHLRHSRQLPPDASVEYVQVELLKQAPLWAIRTSALPQSRFQKTVRTSAYAISGTREHIRDLAHRAPQNQPNCSGGLEIEVGRLPALNQQNAVLRKLEVDPLGGVDHRCALELAVYCLTLGYEFALRQIGVEGPSIGQDERCQIVAAQHDSRRQLAQSLSDYKSPLPRTPVEELRFQPELVPAGR